MSHKDYQRRIKQEKLRDPSYDAFYGVIVIIFIVLVIWTIIDPPSTYQGIH